MADKIMLLDGHSLLNRAFYGLPDLTNAEGKHTNAVLGFLISCFAMSKRRSQRIFLWHLTGKNRPSVI